MAIASMVLGIIALVIGLFFAGFNWIGMIVAIIGIILGALGKKDEARRGMATAGMVMSIVALALSLIVWIACLACVGSVASLA